MSESAYAGIVTTPAMFDAVLVKNTQREWFRFALWEDRIFILDRREEYRNWKDFDEGYIENDKEELHEIYQAYYGKPAPKNAHKVTLTKAIWVKLYLKANDRSKDYVRGGSKDPVTGEKERKRNLNGRRYRIIQGESTEHLQDQALTIHRELLKYQAQTGTETITEAEVVELMNRISEAKILKTKQEPFRIFQYYRPALIKANKLEMFQ
jgi:hypothetical protein